ncbi:uncharacterized protein CIMG_03781 [Coccidioides immitis RS]|uniref:Uncharacterized protein n=4 Tax=Coccidioides immitis TaxID=5501 RepID=J3KC36_COCIM|nr:uncharacterized protein CIMG_03781 [Coccidioides immitis RS]EAS32757.3 hypothetical protein CIMG_03781 [Coccidioides immitis RS]KMP08020.1 hypothetical protein CIRG_07701 [Coccidioides immitis RMSCC 2394]KMU79694.1 hypothetical protein CISG_02112 [Coccidioides immitis RMSCC 3703]KMU85215.1 hypothetical protein CIHG_02998 [Coccidioides immitis H538.4]
MFSRGLNPPPPSILFQKCQLRSSNWAKTLLSNSTVTPFKSANFSAQEERRQTRCVDVTPPLITRNDCSGVEAAALPVTQANRHSPPLHLSHGGACSFLTRRSNFQSPPSETIVNLCLRFPFEVLYAVADNKLDRNKIGSLEKTSSA